MTCDCELLWLLGWIQKTSVKLLSNPKCALPLSFKSAPLRKLKVGVDVHCKSQAGSRELPMVDLSPSQTQVVFEGDAFQLNCRAPSLPDLFDSDDAPGIGDVEYIKWFWLDSNPRNHFPDITIESHYSPDSGLIYSTLSIPKLTQNHTGIWSCQLPSSHTNYSKEVTIIAISNDTKYCPMTTTSDNKGTYTWPRSVVSHLVTVTCESLQLNRNVDEQKASYFCSESEKWERLNTSNCSYTADVTKILEQFSKVNLSLTRNTLLESAKHFRNFTSDVRIFKDAMDLVYAVQTVKNYIGYMVMEKELGTVLMDVLSNLLSLPAAYVEDANAVYGTSKAVVKCVEAIAQMAPTSILHKVSTISALL